MVPCKGHGCQVFGQPNCFENCCEESNLKANNKLSEKRFQFNS